MKKLYLAKPIYNIYARYINITYIYIYKYQAHDIRYIYKYN